MKTPNSKICCYIFVVVAICAITLAPLGYWLLTRTTETKSDEANHAAEQSNGTFNSTSPDSIVTTTISSITTISNKELWENNEEIQIFREYLRIPSVHPDVDYKPCLEFLKKQAETLDFPVSISYPVDEENPVLVMTWEGSQPELPTIMLNSHMDVVPAYPEFWTYPPFAAEMDENGNIYARGAQDMKSVAIQYLAAIRALKREGIEHLKGTVHIVFVPDEEVGTRGLAGFVKTDEFKYLNVDFVLDEGTLIQTDEDVLYVAHGEKTVLGIEFTFQGHSGHASRYFADTPGEKLNYIVNKLMEFRKEEMRKFVELKYPYGNVTTINLTKIKGGVQNNVIPAEMSATFDIRVSVNADLDEFIKMLKRWCDEAGGNITTQFFGDAVKEQVTAVDDTNPYWVAFKNATDEAGIKVEPTIPAGASDSIYVRRLNIFAFGFSPLLNTIPRLHDHDEYISADTFLKGIEIYRKIIYNLGNV